MGYLHRALDGTDIALPVGKVVCIGRNYADHAAELNNPIPDEPLLFMKPATSLTQLEGGFSIPSDKGEVHYETEMALLLGSSITNATPDEALASVSHVGVALDLTLREVQSTLKAKGQPWERAKAFDNACPISGFVPVDVIGDLQDVVVSLEINGELRQSGNSALMLNPVASMLSYMSHCFTLSAGDIVLTGTPAGVGELLSGDKLLVQLGTYISINSYVQ
ncbi:MAG: fumarylacetoacetate hydrolase family protein [Pontibacterium sp.]